MQLTVYLNSSTMKAKINTNLNEGDKIYATLHSNTLLYRPG